MRNAGALGAALAVAMNGPYEGATARIQVRLVERLSSADARVGSFFHFTTTGSTLVAGRFLPAQTQGHGVVVFARPQHDGKPGVLLLAARSLDPPQGDPIDVGLEPNQFSLPTHPMDATVGAGTLFYVDAPSP